MPTDSQSRDYQRLSDLVIQSMSLAIRQKDVAIAEILSRALEMSLTRNAGGRNFIERRSLSPDIDTVLEELAELKKAAKGQSDKM